MENKYAELLPDTHYHIFNRSNAKQKMFITDENYKYFLKLYQKYIAGIADTFCYCLLPNHFHFLIRTKSEESIREYIEFKYALEEPSIIIKKKQHLSNFMSQQFSHLFNSYTQAFNKKFNRYGSLFQRPYKRKKVDKEIYLKRLVKYIHLNPLISSLCTKAEDYNYSSYASIISGKANSFLCNDIIDYFDELSNFIHFHQEE